MYIGVERDNTRQHRGIPFTKLATRNAAHVHTTLTTLTSTAVYFGIKYHYVTLQRHLEYHESSLGQRYLLV